MKLTNVYKLKISDLSKMSFDDAKKLSQVAENKAKRAITEDILKLLTVDTTQHLDKDELEFKSAINIFSQQRIWDILNDLQVLRGMCCVMGHPNSVQMCDRISNLLIQNDF